MRNQTYRSTVVAGMMLMAGFLFLTLGDHYAANGKYQVPLFVAWVFTFFTFLLVVFFARPESVVRLARVEAEPAPAPAPVAARPRPLPEPAFAPLAAAPRPLVLKPTASIPFTYRGYSLYGREVELKNGGKRTIYFFAKGEPKSGSLVAKPAGFHVGVNERTGLPFLKKGAGADGEDLTPEAAEAYRPQCSALTADGAQCRNSARESSKYCSSHFAYHPPTAAAVREETGGPVRETDTRPRVRDAPDTKPAIRRVA